MGKLSFRKQAEQWEREAILAEYQREWLEQWVGASVKFTDKAVEFFNAQSHVDFCKQFNKPISVVRADMVGKVVGGESGLRCVDVDFGAGPNSWAVDWLERV